MATALLDVPSPTANRREKLLLSPGARIRLGKSMPDRSTGIVVFWSETVTPEVEKLEETPAGAPGIGSVT
jgi:hypothetical protein